MAGSVQTFLTASPTHSSSRGFRISRVLAEKIFNFENRAGQHGNGDGITATKGELEQLEVPIDATSLSVLIDQALDEHSPDRRRFLELAAKADEAIMDAFGLGGEQRAYVRERLSTPPFDVMQPRWPWTEVVMRGIQEYPDDRFD